ncbi:MAG TPA: CHAT domain-containing protein, partial [Roseiflexaceae bacterium]|nr:CHAT domain-containing protein [Roseiflexaceae bacterium]
LLRDLYERLVAPLAATLAGFPDLIVVPHGPLHYLPFHALHDGRAFLLERHAISYLPGASLLRYTTPDRHEAGADSGHDYAGDGDLEAAAPPQTPPILMSARPTARERLALGYSNGERLPHAAAEARAVAAILGGQAYVEEQDTLERLRARVGACDVVHLATHGDFRPDNPLFSGLALADGWLTALEMFDLHLNASLVTLSACQTGRSLIGGGDELLGLMRALLYAGAASLLLSLWAVEDRSTAELMEQVYRRLAGGQSKRTALREAQLCLLNQGRAGAPHTHPYYWAPFFLVGDAGPLPR